MNTMHILRNYDALREITIRSLKVTYNYNLKSSVMKKLHEFYEDNLDHA